MEIAAERHQKQTEADRERRFTDSFTKVDRLQAAHAAEMERARMDVDRARDDTKLIIEQVKGLTDRLDRLHRDRVADLARPWWRRLWGT